MSVADRSIAGRAGGAGAARSLRRRPSSAVAVVVVFALSLMIGNTFYGPGDVIRVILGEDGPGRVVHGRASCACRERCSGLLAGFAFGIAGVTFQTMLRNPLASPDVIGISSGASAAAVFGIIVLALERHRGVDPGARAARCSTAAAIYLLVQPGRVRRRAGSSSSASGSRRCSTASSRTSCRGPRRGICRPRCSG